MSEYIVDTFGIVQDFADLHGDMSTPLYQAIMDVMLSRQHEEIVRCRDCIGLVETWDGWECERSSGEYHRAEPDGFCAWAVKRTEGSE